MSGVYYIILHIFNLMQEEETQINGFVLIDDMQGMNLKQAKQMNSKVSKLMTSMMQVRAVLCLHLE
jgi:hypothetical protein